MTCGTSSKPTSATSSGTLVGVAVIGVIFFGALGGRGVPIEGAVVDQDAVAQTFTLALQRAVGYDIAVFLVCFGLIFLLPERVHTDEAARQAPAASQKS